MFSFLSAVGLYLSLSRQTHKADFYMHRFTRVLIPYILIAGTWYGLRYLIIEHNIISFLYNICLLSFWLEHRGAWYVAMLIPAYLIFPWFYEWAETGNRNKKVFGCLILLLILSLIIAFTLPELFKHISQVLCCYIVYLIGYHEALAIKIRNFNSISLSILCTIFFIIRTVTPLRQITSISSITWAMFGIALLVFFARILNWINWTPLNSFLGFWGKYSLELYLWNIFLLQFVQHFGIADLLKPLGNLSGYVIYGTVIGCGIILSIMYGDLTKMISKIFLK